jgi:hypothetical protein
MTLKLTLAQFVNLSTQELQKIKNQGVKILVDGKELAL